MADWKTELRARLKDLDLPAAREADIIEELCQDLDDREQELLALGRTADAARRIALAELDDVGDRTLLGREMRRLRQNREVAPPPGVPGRWRAASLWHDARQAVRTLRHDRAFTLTASLALALGIGANTAIFGAVDTVLLHPMPYPNAERLVVPVSNHVGRDIHNASTSFADYEDWRRETEVFEAVSVWRLLNLDITGHGDPERIEAAQVSEDFFRVIEVRPVLGRVFQPADHAGDAHRVTVISHRLWQSRFGGAPDVVGGVMRVSGAPHEIVGVLPDRAVWPDSSRLFLPIRPSLIDHDSKTRRDNLVYYNLARLKAGVPIARGDAVLAAIAARLEREFPESRSGWTNRLVPLREYIVDGDLRRALWILLGAVGAVLLIACANVANLALVRGSRRARELAVRVALGASRLRLIQQLVIESIVLTTVGAGVGALVAAWVMNGLVTMAPPDTPFVDQLGLNLRVLLAASAAGAVAVVLSGVLPALTSSAVSLGSALKEGSAAAGVSRRAARVRGGLVIAEIAAAVVLLTLAALLIQSFARLNRVDTGVDVDRVIMARVALPGGKYDSADRRSAFFEQVARDLESRPQIERAAATSFVPAGGGGFGLGRVFLAEGWPQPPAGRDVGAQWNVVTAHYFDALGIPIVAGRAFDDRDRADAPPVIIVSESFARRAFPGVSSLGKKMRSWRDENLLREIVGVAAEVKYAGLADPETALVYVPHRQNSWGLMSIVARTRAGHPAALAPVVREVTRAIDADLALADLQPMATAARASIAGQQYAAVLLGALASLALALSAIGIYGVMSYAIALRRREMGIRLALGASRRSVFALVFTQGLRLTAVGLALGLAGAAATSRALDSLLFNTPASDPRAWAAMVLALVVSASLACALPARRAAGADPTGALRSE